MPKVVFVSVNDKKQTEKKEVEVADGANLRQEARKNGVEIYKGLDRALNCRGFGLCGTCRVLVKSGMENLNPKTLMERINFNLHPLSMLARIGHEAEMRLACQIEVHGDCTVEVHPTFNWDGENFWQKPYPNK